MKKPVCFRLETSQLEMLDIIAANQKITKGQLLRDLTRVFIRYVEICRSRGDTVNIS